MYVGVALEYHGRVAIPTDDERLKAARLTEEEFTGELEVNGSASLDLFQILTPEEIKQCRSLPAQAWLDPAKKDGYTLHFKFERLAEPWVFAFYGSTLVGGMAYGDNISVDADHWCCGIGAELCVAGHAQCPEKPRPRKVTELGEKTIRSAYRLVRRVTSR
jgi:hypothetical protein